MHELVQDHVNDTNVDYVCTRCGRPIQFNKQGIGQPCATDNGDGTWAHPAEPEQWMGPCID